MTRPHYFLVDCLPLALALTITSPANSAPISINNASFETPALTCTPGAICFQLNFGGTRTMPAPASVFRPSVGPGLEYDALPDGLQVAALGPATGQLYQDLTATLTANSTYTLIYYVGQRSDFAIGTYSVSLMANGVVLASDSGGAPRPGSFVQRSITYDSGVASSELGQILRVDIEQPRAKLISMPFRSTRPPPPLRKRKVCP